MKFNLQEYKLAERSRYVDPDTGTTMEGPDMQSLNITNLEMMKEKLERKYPQIVWTVEKVKDWINKNFTNKLKPITGPKDLEHKF